MPTLTHEEVKQLIDARRAAEKVGLRIFEKAGKYLLYRLCQPRNVRVASTASAANLKRLVARAAATTSAARP